MTVSVVLPASPFWEMKASVRMQEAWGCVKRAMRVLRFQVTSWGERADWGGVPGRGVELGRLGSLFSGLYRGRPWRDVSGALPAAAAVERAQAGRARAAARAARERGELGPECVLVGGRARRLS